MRDADRTIERLLAGLRDAEPPGGMERRILEALHGREAREVAASASLWRRPLRPAIAMLLACTVILMVGIAVHHQQRHPPATLSHSTRADLRQTTRPEVVVQKVSTVPRRTTSRIPVRHPHDAPGAGETQTASFPAPPLPLTEQERLLLRLAHRGDADNMAILNPDTRAAQTAKAAEQFQQFFAINATEMRSQSE
jgi:cytoskeletal protein RodZ